MLELTITGRNGSLTTFQITGDAEEICTICTVARITSGYPTTTTDTTITGQASRAGLRNLTSLVASWNSEAGYRG